MKLICDCGNEYNFVNQEYKLQTNDYEGREVVRPRNFDLWEIHDVVGIKCCKCGEAIWMFV